jgi:hypothetical protein
MIMMRKLSCVLLLASLPLGCGSPDVPTAPTASSASADKDGGQFAPPKAVKQGRKLVTPGGAGAAEQ